MAQESINYGAFPNDPAANTIRDAFIATQNNFTQLFTSAAANANVARIVAGAGVSVSPANGVGNVTVSANLNSLKVRSNTLAISSLGGYTVGNTVVVPDANATLLIDLSSVPNSNSSVFNLDVVGNLTLSGSNLVAPSANINLTSGNITLTTGRISGKFSVAGGNGAIQYSDGNGIQTGTSIFAYDSALSVLSVPGIIATQVTAANANIVDANFSSAVVDTLNAANLTVSGTIAGNTAALSGNVVAPYFVGNLSGNLANGSIAESLVFYDANGVSTSSANLRYVAGNLELSNGAIFCANIVGNLTGVASLATTVTGAVQANISQLGNLSVLNVTGATQVNTLTANVSITAPSANLNNLVVSNTISSANINSTRANIQSDVTANAFVANVSVSTPSLQAVTGNFTATMAANSIVFTTQTSAPGAPAAGTVYYNGVTGKLQVYNGVLSVWQDLN